MENTLYWLIEDNGDLSNKETPKDQAEPFYCSDVGNGAPKQCETQCSACSELQGKAAGKEATESQSKYKFTCGNCGDGFNTSHICKQFV